MTIASECIIAREMGIAYAAVCVVDNLANGIAAEPLSVAEFEAGKDENRSRLTAAIEAVGRRARAGDALMGLAIEGATLDGEPGRPADRGRR